MILGRQGSGKGTQAIRLSERYGVVHISTGDMLRAAVAAGTELGLRAKAVMDAGELVSDEIMNGIVAERLTESDVETGGFLLDGYPRTVGQAEALAAAAGDQLSLAINLDVPEAEVMTRMKSRGRTDDTDEAIRTRLALYEAETSPLLAWFADRDLLVTVDGLGSEHDVFGRLTSAIDAAMVGQE
ncbi:MAG: adenylate kinase [Acidimicrobiales bacterium]|nr:adenylate kinase [Acidimicrobiales bacterium]